MNPFRTNAKPEATPVLAPPILRSGKWSTKGVKGLIELRWDERSGYVEIGVWSNDGAGAPIQFARLSIADACTVQDTLAIAIRDAVKERT